MAKITMESLTEAGNFLPIQALFYTEGCESHLDLGSNDGRTLRGLDKSTLTAVDLFAPSVETMRKNGIRAYCQDIRAYVGDCVITGVHYDRITSFDVIEHIPKADGEKLLDQLELIAQKEIVIFMPIETPALCQTQKWQDFREEGLNLHPNAQRELHDHRSQWSPEDLQKRGYITLTLPSFHYEGFGAFFAAKYRDPEIQVAKIAEMQAFVKSQNPKPETWGYIGKNPGVFQPLFLNGIDRMFIGDGVSIGYGARLECIKEYGGVPHSPTLTIGDGTTAEFFLHIGCAASVTIGRDCMIAGNVSITDHDHGFLTDRPLHGQPLNVMPVRIGDSVFIGEHTFIGKGVTIGDHAIIGAHSVVVKDVEPYTIVGGVPARVLRTRPWSKRVPVVSIVIPTIDPKAERLKRCLSSLTNAEASVNAHVIVDGQRKGFAATCNRGIGKVIEIRPDVDYICLLNDDTQVSFGWLSKMLAVMDAYPEVGLVGPVSDNVSGPQQRQPMAGPISQEISRLVGFCLLIRRSVIEKIGGIDEAYTLGWYTDDDYCLRAQAAGFKLRVALDAFVHHEFAASYAEANIKMEEANRQGWEVFSTKWGAELRTGGYAVAIPEFSERCYEPLNTEPEGAE